MPFMAFNQNNYQIAVLKYNGVEIGMRILPHYQT